MFERSGAPAEQMHSTQRLHLISKYTIYFSFICRSSIYQAEKKNVLLWFLLICLSHAVARSSVLSRQHGERCRKCIEIGQIDRDVQKTEKQLIYSHHSISFSICVIIGVVLLCRNSAGRFMITFSVYSVSCGIHLHAIIK